MTISGSVPVSKVVISGYETSFEIDTRFLLVKHSENLIIGDLVTTSGSFPISTNRNSSFGCLTYFENL